MDKETCRFIFIAIIYLVYYYLQRNEEKDEKLEELDSNPIIRTTIQNTINIEIKSAWILNHTPINHYCNTVSADDSYYVSNPIHPYFDFTFCEQVNYKNNSTFTIFLN